MFRVHGVARLTSFGKATTFQRKLKEGKRKPAFARSLLHTLFALPLLIRLLPEFPSKNLHERNHYADN